MADCVRQDAVGQGVELRFQATEEELLEALCARTGRPGPGESRRVPLLVGLTLVLAAAVFLPWPLRVLSALALVPLGALLGHIYDRLRLYRCLNGLHSWAQEQGEYTVRVDEAGLHARTRVATSTLHWAAFHRFHETAGLFVLVTGDSASSMCVLPKRGVRDAGGVERLRDLVGRHLVSV